MIGVYAVLALLIKRILHKYPEDLPQQPVLEMM
jgi:hypothetical protein